jgi:hypothetical protein
MSSQNNSLWSLNNRYKFDVQEQIKCVKNWHYIMFVILKRENKKCVYPIGLGWDSHGPYINERQPRRQK